MNDANEVERLRARVAELEGQLATGPAAEPAQPQGRQSAWWATASSVLVVLACILAPLAVASVWASTQLSNTDAYVETVAPLADDPGVQAAITNEVTTAVFDNIDVQGITGEALGTLADQPNVPPRVADALPGLAVPITNGVESFTRTQVGNLVASPEFATLWDQVNRVAHEQVVKLLEGNQGGAVSAQDNTITLNLGPVIAQVKNRLVEQGFSLAANIPTVDKSFVLVQSDSISSAQGFYQLLNTLGTWLPFVVLALFVVGVLLARDRRRALLRGALGVTGAMIVLGVGLALARTWYVGSTPAGVLDEQTAGSVFDTLVRFLRTGLRAAAVLGLVVAFAAFVAGPSTVAARTRSTLQGGIGSLRGGAESAGWSTGRFGGWVFGHRRALRVGVLVLGGLALMFWSRPTGWVVVGVAVAVLVALAVLEFLATPPGAESEAVGGVTTEAEAPTLPRQVPRTPAGPGSDEGVAAADSALHGADRE